MVPPDVNSRETAVIGTNEAGIPPYEGFIKDEVKYSLRMLDTVFEICHADTPVALENIDSQMLETIASRVDMATSADLFAQTKEGDVLVVLMTPSGPFSMKDLNAALGYDVNNDQLIPARHEVISSLFGGRKDVSADMCSYDYKTNCLRISKEMLEQGGNKGNNLATLQSVIAENLKKIEEEVTPQIKTLLDKAMSKNVTQEVRHKQEKLLEALNSGGGFKMMAGMCTVEANSSGRDQDLTNIREAYGRATGAARMSAGNEVMISNINKEWGQVKKFADLRSDLATFDHITDQLGTKHDVLVTEEGGITRLNPYLIQEFRKGRFELGDPQQQKVYDKVREYLAVLNTFDHVLTYTNEELSGEVALDNGETAKNYFDKRSNLAMKLRRKEGTLDEEERKLLEQVVSEDQRDRRYTSREEFHRKAIEMENCVYINGDVLNLGGILLGRYEDELMKLAELVYKEDNPTPQFENNFKKMIKSIGDSVTQDMREMRKQVVETVESGVKNDGLAVYVGGDEVIIAARSENVSDEKILKISKKMRELGLRVIIARNKKDLGEGIGKEESHREAFGALVDGTDYAKSVERLKQGIENYMKYRFTKASRDEGVLLQQLEYLTQEEDLAVERDRGGIWRSIALAGKTIIAGIEEKAAKLEQIKEYLESGTPVDARGILEAIGLENTPVTELF